MPQINSTATNYLVNEMSSFSTSSYMANQLRKFNDLHEYCTIILNSRLPKTHSKDLINEKVKKTGGWNQFNLWIVDEMQRISTLINTVKTHLQTIKQITDHKKVGWDASYDDTIIEVADSLYHQQVPKSWSLLSGANTQLTSVSLASFISDMSTRFTHIEKCLNMGREKMPAYNLSVFYNPQNLLALFKYETMKNRNSADETGCVESIVFQTEMTSRDKEHVMTFYI